MKTTNKKQISYHQLGDFILTKDQMGCLIANDIVQDGLDFDGSEKLVKSYNKFRSNPDKVFFNLNLQNTIRIWLAENKEKYSIGKCTRAGETDHGKKCNNNNCCGQEILPKLNITDWT